MEQLLYRDNGLEFIVTDTFSGRTLVPIIRNVLHKAEHGWDDYDEAYHCCRLVEAVKRNPGMTMDFHHLRQGGDTVGTGILTHGALDIPLLLPDTVQIPEAKEKILIFNYFHISVEGRGNGERWLREVIMPYYGGRGFDAMYVKSSHPQVFSLYERLGRRVGEYVTSSDNGLWVRPGVVFRIPLTK